MERHRCRPPVINIPEVFGAQKLAEGYLAISLDLPVVTVLPGNVPVGLNRTGNSGENEGN